MNESQTKAGCARLSEMLLSWYAYEKQKQKVRGSTVNVGGIDINYTSAPTESELKRMQQTDKHFSTYRGTNAQKARQYGLRKLRAMEKDSPSFSLSAMQKTYDSLKQAGLSENAIYERAVLKGGDRVVRWMNLALALPVGLLFGTVANVILVMLGFAVMGVSSGAINPLWIAPGPIIGAAAGVYFAKASADARREMFKQRLHELETTQYRKN